MRLHHFTTKARMSYGITATAGVARKQQGSASRINTQAARCLLSFPTSSSSARSFSSISSSSSTSSSSARSFSSSARSFSSSSSKTLLESEFFKLIKSNHEKTLQPLNSRLMGPLDKSQDLFSPMAQVLILGNHSSGKSSFINFLCGRVIQATGTAPTDDSFSLIAPGEEDVDQDGPSVVGDPSLGLSGLRAFGSGLVNHISLKIRKDSLLKDVMLIDSPGMIDSPSSHGVSMRRSSSSSSSSSSPGNYNNTMNSGSFSTSGYENYGNFSSSSSIRGGAGGGGYLYDERAQNERGYNFAGTVKWLAERADVILLFQDPAKPGTTGETLSILTRSLAGLEHKLFIILNKADEFTTVHDFARAYGALCWNLSKVIHRKDLPRIYTMCVPVDSRGKPILLTPATAANAAGNSTASNDASSSSSSAAAAASIPTSGTLKDAMADLASARAEIVAEVRRAPLRRIDNMVTRLYDSSRLLRMYATVLQEVKKDYTAEAVKMWAAVAIGGGSLAAAGGGLLFAGAFEIGAPLIATAVAAIGGGGWFVNKKLSEKYAYAVNGAGLDDAFRRSNFLLLAEKDESITQLYERVKPHLQSTLRTMGIRGAPAVKRSDLLALDDIIESQVPSLRKAATKAVNLTGTTPGASSGWFMSGGGEGNGFLGSMLNGLKGKSAGEGSSSSGSSGSSSSNNEPR